MITFDTIWQQLAANMIVSHADPAHINEAYARLHDHDDDYYP